MKELLNKFKKLTKRQQIVISLAVLLVLVGIALLIWGIVTGRIKPKAAGVQISNTASVTYQDAAGNNYSASSNTVLIDVISSGATINITFALNAGTNFSTAGTIFAICPAGSSAGTSTNICGSSTALYTNPSVTTDSSGNASFALTPPAAGNYDYKIHANGYLVKAVKNTAYADPLSLNWGALKAGDLDGDNTVTAADFIAFRSKFLGTDQIVDFDHDGKVTASDFITFRKNFLQGGD